MNAWNKIYTLEIIFSRRLRPSYCRLVAVRVTWNSFGPLAFRPGQICGFNRNRRLAFRCTPTGVTNAHNLFFFSSAPRARVSRHTVADDHVSFRVISMLLRYINETRLYIIATAFRFRFTIYYSNRALRRRATAPAKLLPNEHTPVAAVTTNRAADGSVSIGTRARAFNLKTVDTLPSAYR